MSDVELAKYLSREIEKEIVMLKRKIKIARVFQGVLIILFLLSATLFMWQAYILMWPKGG